MTQESRGLKPLLAAAGLIVAVAVLLLVWQTLRPKPDPETMGTADAQKTVTVQVVHGDGSTKEAAARTEAENLAQVLTELEELAVVGENGPYGLYIRSVDGETASDSDHTYWRLSRDGEDLLTGAEGQMVADGEHYELTLTTW